jgi:hypothetical protein
MMALSLSSMERRELAMGARAQVATEALEGVAVVGVHPALGVQGVAGDKGDALTRMVRGADRGWEGGGVSGSRLLVRE